MRPDSVTGTVASSSLTLSPSWGRQSFSTSTRGKGLWWSPVSYACLIQTYLPSSLTRHPHLSVSHKHPKLTLPWMNPPFDFPASLLGLPMSVNGVTMHQSINGPLDSALFLLFPIFSLWNGKISLLISVNSTTAFGALPVAGLNIPALLNPRGTIKPALDYEQKHCVCPSARTFKSQFVTHYVYFSFCHNSCNAPHKEASLSSWVLEWGRNGEEPQTAYNGHVFWVRKPCKTLRLEGSLVPAAQPSTSRLIPYPDTCTTREKPALTATESGCYRSTTEHILIGKLPQQITYLDNKIFPLDF